MYITFLQLNLKVVYNLLRPAYGLVKMTTENHYVQHGRLLIQIILNLLLFQHYYLKNYILILI